MWYLARLYISRQASVVFTIGGIEIWPRLRSSETHDERDADKGNKGLDMVCLPCSQVSIRTATYVIPPHGLLEANLGRIGMAGSEPGRERVGRGGSKTGPPG